MAPTIPTYVSAPDIGNPDLDYIWDDTRTAEDFETDGKWIPENLKNTQLTAKIALGIGIFEWIDARYRPLTNDAGPGELAQSAWCATVHPAYMEEALFDRHAWRGPIRGPLWCAQTWLVPMARCDVTTYDECESGLDFLYCLAMHVLPSTSAFESWLEGCIDRIIELYPAPEPDPFANLFDDPRDMRGPLVAPPLLDLDEPFDPDDAAEYMARFLADARGSGNPYLASPDAMIAEGFKGTPYEIDVPEQD